MTKKNIVRRIADELNRTELETRLIVQKTLDAIINVLAEEGRVELRNFGVSVHDYHQGFRRRLGILGCSLGQDRWVMFKSHFGVESHGESARC